VVVKRTAILSCWNCVYVCARQPTLLQCIPRVKRFQQERKSEIGKEQLHNRHNGNLIHCDLRNESNQMRHPNHHYTRNAKQIKITQRKKTLLSTCRPTPPCQAHPPQFHHCRCLRATPSLQKRGNWMNFRGFICNGIGRTNRMEALDMVALRSG